ncbi:MAG: hypothetical protein AB7P20_11455 [Rhizobiaceae bacterium]
MNLMALWSRHKQDCRPIGSIIVDARAGKLPGVQAIPHGFEITNEQAALAAMRRA